MREGSSLAVTSSNMMAEGPIDVSDDNKGGEDGVDDREVGKATLLLLLLLLLSLSLLLSL